MPPDDRLGTVHWVVKSFVELAANAGIVGVLVSLENRGGNMEKSLISLEAALLASKNSTMQEAATSW